jgi:uroporphyrinogen-III synthase
MTHILLTRPLEASQQLARQLSALGLIPVVMPMYSFSARQPGRQMDSAWHTPVKRRLAVFTSPRAVQYGLAHIPDGAWNDLEVAVIGSATRAKLESAGIDVQLQAPAGFTSEDLLQLQELTIDPGVAVIFCAPGGRETLAEGLHTLGWHVVKAMVYERRELQPASEQLNALLGADGLLSVWTSISAINIAEETLPEAVWEKILKAPALVISARIQHHLQQLGATGVELADGPGNPALLQSIQRLTGRHTPC